MKIVVALDKFKGSLSAPEACEIVREALLATRPKLEIVVKPMADGGDGTAEVLRTALGGEWISRRVTGPLPTIPSTGRYLWVADRKLAVIEMAAASGLVLLRPDQRNPLCTTTRGTGELIRDAVERGARKILLGVGGSATVDGGVGAAMALGWRFLDGTGKPVGLGGAVLERIAKIVPAQSRFRGSGIPAATGRDKNVAPTMDWPAVEVLCDVDNPLCGEQGAARVFGPQKGATQEMVERLDAGLNHLADIVATQLGKDIADVAGAGAAGGLAAGAIAFMNARLVPGIDTIMSLSGLDGELADADWVITGEGKFDEQSLRGKVVHGAAKLARKHGVKVAVIAGSVQVSEKKYRAEGIELALPTMKPGMTLDEALARAEELLAETARSFAGKFLEL